MIWAAVGLLTLLVLRRLYLRHLLLRAGLAHRLYAHDRVHNRKRPGWHPDQEDEAIVQRAGRRGRWVLATPNELRRLLSDLEEV